MTMNDDMNTSQNTPIQAHRFAQYIDQNGDPQIILVSSTETEETLQRHFESTVGKRLHVLGFYWDTDMHPNPTRYPIGTLDNARISVIRLASENVKLRDKAAKYDQLIKDLGVEMRDPDGTIWDEAKRLQAENKRLELEIVILRHALIQIHYGHDGHRPIDTVKTAWIALNATTAPK